MLHSAVALAAACVSAEKGEAGTLGLVARSLLWPEDHACTARELSHPCQPCLTSGHKMWPSTRHHEAILQGLSRQHSKCPTYLREAACALHGSLQHVHIHRG